MAYNILLVDDDREFREEFRDFLHDYNVVEASNGNEALELLSRPNEIDVVILDVMCIAFGFLFRVLAGTALAGVRPSEWLIICTIMLSLFLGFSKRRHELTLMGLNATNHRKVLTDYSATFLDQMIAVASACTVMSYALYTVSPQTVYRFGTRNLAFSIPFVIYGIYRYLYLIHQKNMGGNPTRELVRDRPLLINALLWALVVVLIIY